MEEKIIFASIEPTNICNLDCATCSRSYMLQNYKQIRVGSISEGFLEKIKEILPDLTEIKFHGLGEPFLAKNTVGLHKKMKELYPNANIISITNASMPNLPIEVKDYLDHIVISIDHARKEMLEKLRKKASYELIIENVIKLTSKNTAHQPKITINSCFNMKTYKEIYEMVIFAKALGVEDIRFNLVQNWVDDIKYSLDNLLMSKINIDSLAESINRMTEIARQLNMSVKIVGNPDFRIEECQWAGKMAYITKDGDVAPCCMRTEPKYYFGSFLSKKFSYIWEGAEMEDFRSRRKSGRYPEMCRRCPYLDNSKILKELESRGISLTNDFIGHKYKE